MRFALSVVFALLAVAGQGFAQEDVSPKRSRFALHPEAFVLLGHSYVDRTPESNGHIPGGFTAAVAMQFAPGSRQWVTCDPNSDPECTEANAPRWAFGGVGVAWAPNTEMGLGLHFPLLTVRVVRNAWLGTAVNAWPWASHGRRNVAFNIGLSICVSPDDGW
jgi:hypothetical protein